MAEVVWGLGVGVAVVAGGRATCRWARHRCDEALAAARLIPVGSERSFALLGGLDGRTADRAQVRQQRAIQLALDAERRGGAFLARRATSTVPPEG